MSDVEILQGWGSFDAAVYKFVHECVEGERGADGSLRSAGRKLWAYGYMPAFFRRMDEDVFEGEDLDEKISSRLKWKGVSYGGFKKAGALSMLANTHPRKNTTSATFGE
jgi:hypothetical protein